MKRIKVAGGAGRGRGAFFAERGVKPQLIALLICVTLIATFATGWLIYDYAANELIDDAWRQSEVQLDTARAAVNRQYEQMCSFSWQLSNNPNVMPILYARDQTPENILAKRDLIDLLQGMKAFSDTLSDIGLYLPMTDSVLTAESSYHTADYFARLSDGAFESLQQVRQSAAGTALSDYVGVYSIQRIISRDQALLFVSDLPVGQRAALGFAYFLVRMDKLKALLPKSGSGAILLTDASGAPLLSNTADDELYSRICALAEGRAVSKLRYEQREYSVLQADTDVDGLRCTAVVPYSDIIARAESMRGKAMLIICLCLAFCLGASMWFIRRLYAPIAGLMAKLEQLGHALPKRGDRNEFVLLGDALRMISDQNRELRLGNRQIQRLLKNRLLGDFIEGRLQRAALEPLREAGVTLAYSFAQVAVIDLDAQGLRRVSEGLGTNAADWIEQQRARGDYGALEVWCAQREDGRLLVLFNIDAGHPHPESLYDYLEQCDRVLSAYAPARICVGRSYRLGEVSSSLIDAMIALHGDAASGKAGVLPAEEVDAPPDTAYPLATEQRLLNCMMSLQADEVDRLLDELCSSGAEGGSPVLRGSMTQALLFTARRAARQAGVEALYLQSLERERLQSVDLPQGEDMANRVRSVFHAVLEGVGQSRVSQDKRLYQRLCDYIQQEYMRDISLDTASEALGLSPSYIGLIFRRSGDTSFTRTLTDVRIAQAKRLLSETELTVYEIGQQVGIENQNTFIRAFKKVEGVTPGQYRVAKASIPKRI